VTVRLADRLADLLAGLSRLADLGFGLEPGEALRSCALAAWLGRSMDLLDEDTRAAFYTALLQHVGCTGYTACACPAGVHRVHPRQPLRDGVHHRSV
jgi:hypothetical protein